MGISFIRLKTLPLLLPALAWVCGLILVRSDTVSLAFCVYTLGLLLLLLLKWRHRLLMTCSIALVYGLLSLAADVQRIHIDDGWLHQKIYITATVEDVKRQPQYTKLRLTDIVKEDGARLSAFANVYVYRSTQQFSSGMKLKAQVKFHLPHNKLNPVTFDYEQHAFAQHIAVIGSVSGRVEMVNEDMSWLELLRSRIRNSLTSVDAQGGSVLSALLLADRSHIPAHIGDAFAASGATHLLAISGLHVGLVAGWGFMLSWWLLTRREDWIVLLPVRTISLISGALLAMGYATLAGWPIPAQRAFLMLLAGVLAWLLRAKQSPLNTMFAALIFITLLDPAAVLSISLWLSFMATSALLIWAVSQPRTEDMMSRAWMWLKGLFWVSVIASLATLPLIGFIFERFPIWGVVANMMLIPLYAVWILPLALFGEISSLSGLDVLADFLFGYAVLAIHLANELLLYMQTLPAGNLWLRGDKPIADTLLAVTLLLCGGLILKQRYKSAVPLLSLTLLMYGQMMLGESKVESAALHVWDVGQGASALLRVPGFNVLLDAPGKQGSKFNGGTIAADNARGMGLLHLDALVLSHAQSDHAGGTIRLLASLNSVNELWLADVPSNRTYPAIKEAMSKVKVRWLKQGDIITSDEARFEVLWPPAAYQPNNGNNASLVLLVTLSSGQKILFPGDIEKKVEKTILASLPPVDVLLMPHHGSKTSSTSAFVKRTQPKIVIAQAGYKNHYGFPKAEVVQRYKDVGSRVWNTAEGAVSVSFYHQTQHVNQFVDQKTPKRKQMEMWLSTYKL